MIDMTSWKIPLYKIFTDSEITNSASKVLKRNMDWTMGPEVIEFEKSLSKYVGTKYSILFNSGTSALHASLIALGIKKTEKVVVPSFTFISTANSVLMNNSIPKFVDIESKNLGIDPLKLEKSFDNHTKSIIPVHYAGLACKIKEISEIAKRKKIPIIEDCAEALGSKVDSQMVGTFGKLSMFSFAPNKIITTGEGGAVLTDSKQMFEKLKLIRSHGRKESQNYFQSNLKPNYVTLGYNWRMSSISAAIGLAQLQKIEKIIKLRRKCAQNYSSKLKNLKIIEVPNEPSNSRHVFQLYSILLPNTILRSKLMNHLTKNRIMSKIYFEPIHKSQFFKKLNFDIHLPVTENVAGRIISLPLFPNMKNEEQQYVINSIKEFVEMNSNY